ncbi:MAG: YncE family protein [Candidatus Baltobacteraceae bacterium]
MSVFANTSAASVAPADLPLKKLVDIALPGKATRLDYQTLDTRKQLLFIAHLGEGNVVVVNTAMRRVVATIADLRAVHGVLAVARRNTLYASATGTDEVVAIDESSLKIKTRIPGGIYPDGMAYDPDNGRLFVSDEHGDTDTVIDTTTNRRIATIRLGGEAGNTQYDAVSHHMFVNVQTLGQLLEINPQTNRVLRKIALPGCEGNHSLLIDPVHRRAFIACEDNATFVWLDMREMRIVQEWRIGTDPDVLALDPVTHRLYAAAESGVVTVFDDDSVRRLAQGYLAPRAHTVAVDPRTHLVYFPLEDVDGAPFLRVMEQPAPGR